MSSTRTLAAAFAALALLGGSPAGAASHREAPKIALDPAADVSDFYAFVSYDAANLGRAPADRKLTFVMNVLPGQEPGSGPNYFDFDDEVVYQIVIDNDRSGGGLDDLVYEFRFETQVTDPAKFVRPVALAPVTELEGPGAAALASIQRYRVTELRDCRLRDGELRECKRTPLFGGRALPTVPSNIGPRTTPDYEQLAAQGVFSDAATGVRAFVGPRAETFAIDLGAVFDTLNLRVETPPGAPGRPPLPVNTAAEDANDAQSSFGNNTFSGFNVSSIALEVPIARVTRDRRAADATNGAIGAWARTLRPKRVGKKTKLVQVARIGNPLVNELIIRFGSKDRWNAALPEHDAQFLDMYRNLAVGDALELVSGVPVPDAPRDDIASLLLQYQNGAPGAYSDLLRLDLNVPPTPPAQIARLGPFAHDALGNPAPTPFGDPAGFPNGRRPNDDVTDVIVRAVGGASFIASFVSDGVHVAERGVTAEFPFLPTPFDGRNRRHVDPGE